VSIEFPKGMSHKRAVQWLAEHNPHVPGTYEFHTYAYDFWTDQRDKAWRKAQAWLIVAGVFLTISLVAQIVGLVTP
jgi:hypothetical protein